MICVCIFIYNYLSLVDDGGVNRSHALKAPFPAVSNSSSTSNKERGKESGRLVSSGSVKSASCGVIQRPRFSHSRIPFSDDTSSIEDSCSKNLSDGVTKAVPVPQVPKSLVDVSTRGKGTAVPLARVIPTAPMNILSHNEVYNRRIVPSSKPARKLHPNDSLVEVLMEVLKWRVDLFVDSGTITEVSKKNPLPVPKTFADFDHYYEVFLTLSQLDLQQSVGFTKYSCL